MGWDGASAGCRSLPPALAPPTPAPDLLLGPNTELPSSPLVRGGGGEGGTRSPPGRELIRRRRRPAAPGRDLAGAAALRSSGEEPGGCSWRRPALGGRRSRGATAWPEGPSPPPPHPRRQRTPRGPPGLSRQPREEGALSLAGPELQRQRGARPRGGERKKGAESARPGGDSWGRVSANLRALTRGAAPGSRISAGPGAGRREARPRGRCTCPGTSLAAPCAPQPGARPLPVPPTPPRSASGPRLRGPALRSRPFSVWPARRLARPTDPLRGWGEAVARRTPGQPHPGLHGPWRRAPARRMSAETPRPPLRARGLTPLRPQLRGRGPPGAAAPERRQGTAPRWPGQRALWRRAPSTWCGPGGSPRAGSRPTPGGR